VAIRLPDVIWEQAALQGVDCLRGKITVTADCISSQPIKTLVYSALENSHVKSNQIYFAQNTAYLASGKVVDEQKSTYSDPKTVG